VSTVPTVARSHRWFVLAMRWGLPLIFLIGGIALILLGHGHVANVTDNPSSSVFSQYPTDSHSMDSALGVSAIIVALMIVMIGWFMRLNSRDGADRDREEAARDYFSRTGRWPGEQGPRGSHS
jgi:hypothetical protein